MSRQLEPDVIALQLSWQTSLALMPSGNWKAFQPQGVEELERETGIEPATSSLGSWRSTAELLPLATGDIQESQTKV
jgi:hypothetical protein